jgi:hypothetical protein
MQRKGYRGFPLGIGALAALLFFFVAPARGQQVTAAASESAGAPEAAEAPAEIHALVGLVRDLQSQVQALNAQLGDLRAEQERARAEARALRLDLEAVKGQGGASAGSPVNSYSAPAAQPSTAQYGPASSITPQQAQSPGERLSKVEDDQQLIEGKIDDLYQTKVESGSKYRLRLSGIVLLNLFENRGTVDNLDFPEVAETEASQQPNASAGAFGGTLRQSQIRLQAFGPDIAGAHTSADVNLDFAGGLADTANGAWMGNIRMRTAVMRLDWSSTSIVAGQDRLFFAPLSPTSLASVAIPALSYSGNLWAWTPQVRVEHRFTLSDDSTFSLQGGILDSPTGDYPPDDFDRYPTWGEESGQPAYAVRAAWSHRLFGQDFTAGVAGFYGRQVWGFSRSVDGWAGMADMTLPLGKYIELTGEFYRGRSVAGLGGGIGQSVYISGSFLTTTSRIWGLDSMGGWAQLKFKVRSNFEINGAFGSDNPFARELRQSNSYALYPEGAYTRNWSPFVNFIYQIRSDVLFSTEYRYLNSTVLDSGSIGANQVNLSLGYIF